MAPLRCSNSSCSARAFVQLAKRRYATTAAPTTTGCLEFLAPRAKALPARASYGPARPLARQSRAPQSFPMTISRRAFTSSAPRRATVCVQNPVQDEDGNEMMLEITPRAAKRLSEIMAKDSNPDLALRIQVESGGCHGFQYLMSLITVPQKDAADTTAVSEEDSIFQYKGEDPAVGSKHDGARIILDEPSLDLLKGSKVDFTQELIGSQFKIVDNPLATSSCGCGTSFDIKM